MEIKQVKINDLQPADYNPRIMPPAEMEALKKSIAAFGFVEPVIVNHGRIVGGHQRIEALRALLSQGIAVQGIEGDLVPVVEVDLDEAGERQLNIALNKIGGRFDTIKLKDLLRSAKGDLNLTGFSKAELQNLLAPIEVPEDIAFSKVTDDDEPEFSQMSFILNRKQKELILQAVEKVSTGIANYGETPEQRRGILLVEIAKAFLALKP